MPTLTEVVELIEPREPGHVPHPGQAEANTNAALELTAEVLFELEQRIDSLFEARLREALAPALARAADTLIHEARQELSGALRELVEDALTRALESRTRV